jgi:PhzF family phenazine biosynthesis protein
MASIDSHLNFGGGCKLKQKIEDVLRLAAFSDGRNGGNPAGVLISDQMPGESEMLAIADEVNYSETAFVVPLSDDKTRWKVRYFAPKVEVPFCGHATIALTAALAERTKLDSFTLELNEATITTSATLNGTSVEASLISPPTSSQVIGQETIDEFCALFGIAPDHIDLSLPPALINGGASHILLALNDRKDLAEMKYDFDEGLAPMKKHGLVTIMLVWVESAEVLHTRNAFATGGVVEDPATGAAAAAFSGYLKEIGKFPNNGLTLIQGEDMGMRSVIKTSFDHNSESGVKVSGNVRKIEV